ncbi:MAG TPA: hypothetical protein VF121_16875 [Thermoanaerobaculia bacterium]|nr:hypothetical protein [Thermoanaerobaculia bacterium]
MRPKTVVVALLGSYITAVSYAAANQISNYELPGNLESKYDLECVGQASLSNKYTPADLYRAVAKCVDQGKYKEGAFLFALAGVYGRFDALRVADRTAHQAVDVLFMQALGPLGKAKHKAFKKAIKALVSRPDSLAAACKGIATIGAPDYYPRYMVQHGLDAFSREEPADGLVADFDAESTWKEALDTYLHCPGLR